MVLSDYRVGYVVADGEARAVFLDSGPETGPGKLTVYARVGERSEAATSYLRGLPLADEPHYRQLRTYLARRYADGPGAPLNLVVDHSAVPR